MRGSTLTFNAVCSSDPITAVALGISVPSAPGFIKVYWMVRWPVPAAALPLGCIRNIDSRSCAVCCASALRSENTRILASRDELLSRRPTICSSRPM